MKKYLLIAFVLVSSFSIAQKVNLIIPKGHTAAVSDAVIFGNNRYLISGGRDNSIKIWDIKGQKEINSLIGEKGRDAYSFVGVSADEKYFFRGGSKEVTMWEMATQKLVFNSADDNAFYKDFFPVPNSNYIYYRSSVGTKKWEIFRLNTSTGTSEKIYSTNEECKFQKVLYAADGSYLLYCPFDSYEKTDIVKVSLPSGKKEETLKNIKSVSGIAMVNKSKAVYWTDAGEYVFFDPATGNEQNRFKSKHFEDICFSSDGKLMVAKENFTSASIAFYNAQNGENIFANTELGHKSMNKTDEQILSFKFSEDNKYLVTTGLDRQAIVWNCKTGEKVFATNTNIVASARPNKAIFSPQSRFILIDDLENSSLINWDINKSAPKYKIENYTSNYGNLSFDISPDEKQIAAPGKLNNINFYAAETGVINDLGTDEVSGVHYLDKQTLIERTFEEKSDKKKYRTLPIGQISGNKVFADYETFLMDYVSFNNAKGEMARANMESGIQVYNIQTGEKRLADNDKGILQWICYNHTGTKLYASYEHPKKWGVQYTIIYDAVTLKQIKKINFAMDHFCISKDDRLMAGVSFNNEFDIELYDLQSEKLLTTLNGHHAAISSVYFSPNEKMLISTSGDHTTRIWSVEEKKELIALISFVNNDWAVVMPDGRFDASEGAQKRMYLLPD
ncbi:MAG: WD40 repeat domain-containing protein [Sphingobacteriales bacterium]|nr:WD40 repeat domain-containing protein [Sphingobacteriales bacterium]